LKLSYKGGEIKLKTNADVFLNKIFYYLTDEKFLLRYKSIDDNDFKYVENKQIPQITNDNAYVLIAEKNCPYSVEIKLLIHRGCKEVTFTSRGNDLKILIEIYQVIKNLSRK